MSEDLFSLDSLLEDLDAAVHSPQSTAQPAGGTMKFVPHPPARDKQTSHTTTFNPKNRFAVQPSSASTSPEAPNDNGSNRSSNRFAYGSPDKPVSAYGSAAVAPSSSQSKFNRADPDENSLDNLLNLISSPSQPQSSAAKPAQTVNAAFSYSNQPSSSSALNSQYFLESQKVGSGAGHSGRFPSMTGSDHATNTTTFNNTTTYNNMNNTNNTNNTNSYNNGHIVNSGYIAHTITADSNMSSPFDSPSSHGSAQKTYNNTNSSTSHYAPHANTTFGSPKTTHSTSLYNMNTNTIHTNNTTNSSSFQPNLASSFDSAESGSERVPALFNSNTNNVYSSNTVVYGSGNGGNSHLQPISTTTDNTYPKGRSGTGVSGGLFGATNTTSAGTSTNNTTNTTTSYSTHSDNHHSYANAVSPRGNTATFTSQNASQNSSLRAQNEPNKAQNAHFLPTSINATTVVSNSSGGASSASSGAVKQKCSRVVIGGASVPRGRKTSAFANFACNNLRCLQCNFKVHCFSNSEWDNSVDYMFLRNTVPNEAKLALKLTRSAEKCAYCCQCSSASEGGERELSATLSAQGPQWVCAGH